MLQANAIINSLTASLSKVQAALADLNGHSKPHVWLMTYVQTTKDKQVSLPKLVCRIKINLSLFVIDLDFCVRTWVPTSLG